MAPQTRYQTRHNQDYNNEEPFDQNPFYVSEHVDHNDINDDDNNSLASHSDYNNDTQDLLKIRQGRAHMDWFLFKVKDNNLVQHLERKTKIPTDHKPRPVNKEDNNILNQEHTPFSHPVAQGPVNLGSTS